MLSKNKQKKGSDLNSLLSYSDNSLFSLIPVANITIERPFVLLGSHLNNKYNKNITNK